MSRKTIDAPHGSYTGMKCPACPAVIQPAPPVTGGKMTERVGLLRHWLICHPERPIKQLDAR